MRIAIDISALQSGHRMRGIGFTIINLINNIDRDYKNTYIFFLAEAEAENALSLLNLDGLGYEVRHIQSPSGPIAPNGRVTIIRLKRLISSSLRQSKELKDRYLGSKVYGDMSDIDVFIQPDQQQKLPRGKVKTVMVLYDIIPYVLEWDYLWSYKTARLRGLPILSSFRCLARRWIYLKKLAVGTRKADLAIAISEATKRDFVRIVGLTTEKIQVVPLGVSRNKVESEKLNLQRYHKTSWGYMPRKYKLDESTPYILYVGGADHRRRLDDLVAAFNGLRAEGININLILTGDIMQGPDHIPTPEINRSMNTSSYLEDMIFLGFVPDDVKNLLYQKALVFVYPSKYEGFGLPVLEAMSHGTPVITYQNSSIPEVGGNAVIYANNYQDIAKNISRLLASKELRKKYSDAGLAQSEKFSWAKTSQQILDLIA